MIWLTEIVAPPPPPLTVAPLLGAGIPFAQRPLRGLCQCRRQPVPLGQDWTVLRRSSNQRFA
eukprot:2398280-Lingulodinium_polyedra.AAC.1